jgi:N-acetylneuraminic acid mutarotase
LKFSTLPLAMAIASLSLTACGGGGGGETAPLPADYNIGGTISNLSGAGLVLQNNGGDNLSVGGNESFTFSAPVATGGAYNVTVLTQPSSPPQSCAVTNGTGTANANVTNVQIGCVGEWTWVNGADVIGHPGVYGTQGTPAASNIPGARDSAVSWTDTTGDFWIFGGEGYDSAAKFGDLNDLWRYSLGQGMWTWIGGPNIVNQPGTYGTQGKSAPGNVPGARYDAVGWTDAAGNFWLFGGHGSASTPGFGELNDLWKYSGGTWTWMSGSNASDQIGTYGTQGTAAPGNIPGARDSSASWTDAAGNLWLFGGDGSVSAGQFGDFNDLWSYSVSEGMWTWIGGSNLPDQRATYGIQGTAARANIPGARDSAVSWINATGNFWLFGGEGFTSTAESGFLNDLWKYNASAGEWTWISGANSINQPGMYGTLGIAAPGNVPGERIGAAGWTDAAGNLWLFGGWNGPHLNDLWKYSPSTDAWTWMGGSDVGGVEGTYGILGTAAPLNIPGGRLSALAWIDPTGSLWLFGGEGLDSAAVRGDLNDLWKYQP